MLLEEVRAWAITDSRGESTIEVSINRCAPASAPAGKSTGTYETPPYKKNLKWNIDFLNSWKPALSLKTFDDLEKVEVLLKRELKLKDATLFGANALFALESAVLKALAHTQKKELWQLINSRARRFPRPVGNSIGGGLHSTRFKQHPLFQEFLLIPHEKTFEQNVAVMKNVHEQLGRLLHARDVNDEGAWHTPLSDEEVLSVMAAFNSLLDIGIDAAASSFYKRPAYKYTRTNRTPNVHQRHMEELIHAYELWYVEDPFEENDFSHFAALKKKCRESLIVGDDLTVTHIERLQKAVAARALNALIVKPNQNGSLINVRNIIDYCKKHSITTVMSHRSGETMDNALADYAFGFGADYIKCGIATPWREVKLRRMIEIERSLK